MYSIVDLEATGGKFNEESIIEIAIYKYDGSKVIDQFISLVNPHKDITSYVEKLTGISAKMVNTAPTFSQVAKRIIEITDNSILVAHNAQFDYRLLQIEFDRLGYEYIKESICTVILSQNLLPNQESYKLGKLVKSLGIPLTQRHRASGDARATVELFKLLIEKDINKQIISKNDKKAPKLNSENTRINWNNSIDSIIGNIRGLTPKPGAWTILYNNQKIRIKILKARAENYSENKSNNILSIRNRKIFISTLKGEIECEIIQFENKKAMTAKDVLNGFEFSSNCYVN